MQAAIKINSETQAKLNRVDVSEYKLFNEAFTLKPAAAGANRLRMMKDDGSDNYKSLHEGARAFAEGLYRAIRNPGMHTPLPSTAARNSSRWSNWQRSASSQGGSSRPKSRPSDVPRT